MSESSSPASGAAVPRPRHREKLLLVGFTSCDQAVAERLMAAGAMPNLARLCAGGARGRLQAPEPLVSRAVWTSIATGRQPAIHGVAAPWVPRIDGGGARRPGKPDWKSPAYWQILEAGGRKTVTVNWPATAPARDWPGVHVDERFAMPTGPDFDSWALPRHAVAPASIIEDLRALRVHPADIAGTMLAPFVPGLPAIDQYRDAGLSKLAVALAAVSSVHAAATALIETQDWDVASVQYGWLDGLHRAAALLPAGSPYGGVMDTAYAFSDAMLGRLMQLAGEETTIWMVSPNGVRSGPGQTAAWRPGGFIAARGRWIEAGSTLPPMRLTDIAPSLLARFGLVMEADGKTIPALAPGQSRRTVVLPLPAPSVPGDTHVAALKALGYDDALSPGHAVALQGARALALIAKGEAHLAAGRVTEAETALLAARALLPPDSPAGLQRLALCRLMRSDAIGCRHIGETLMRIAPATGWADLIVAAGHALDDDAEAARPFMAAALEKGRDNADLVNRLGGVALLLEDAVTARLHFQAALDLDPEMEAARHGLAMVDKLEAGAEAG